MKEIKNERGLINFLAPHFRHSGESGRGVIHWIGVIGIEETGSGFISVKHNVSAGTLDEFKAEYPVNVAINDEYLFVQGDTERVYGFRIQGETTFR